MAAALDLREWDRIDALLLSPSLTAGPAKVSRSDSAIHLTHTPKHIHTNTATHDNTHRHTHTPSHPKYKKADLRFLFATSWPSFTLSPHRLLTPFST